MNMFLRNTLLILLSTLIIPVTSTLFSKSAIANTNDRQTILITGANRGIGLALAKKFHHEGYKVIATARTPSKAAELNKLGVQVEQLDITNQKSADALKKKLSNQSIDILLNNAGISGHSTREFKDLEIDRLGHVFEVNSLGALRVTQALLPNLEKGSKKVVASISSRMGSIEENTGGNVLGYRASKTALNSFNKSLSLEFAEKGFAFVVLHPGWVRTDMTSESATYSTSESADNLFKVISKLNKKDNGKFFDLHGKSIAW